jgi:hypothetical protein
MALLDSNEIVGVTLYTIDVLTSHRNWWDALLLYFKYIKQSKIQQTNQSWSLDSFMMRWMWWWNDRFKSAKALLKKLWLIELIQKRWVEWKIETWYVKTNFIINEQKIKQYSIEYEVQANLSTSTETHQLDSPPSGERQTNALSTKCKCLKYKIETNTDEKNSTDADAISTPVEEQRPMKVKKTKPKIEYPQDIEELYQTIKKTSWVIVDSKEHAMIELQEKLKTTSAEKILELSRITWRAIKVWILDAQYIKRMWRWVRDLDTEWELQENSVIKYILDKAIAITVHHKKRWTEASKKWTMKDDIAPLLIWWLDENWILNNALRLYYRKWTDSLMDNPNIK